MDFSSGRGCRGPPRKGEPNRKDGDFPAAAADRKMRASRLGRLSSPRLHIAPQIPQEPVPQKACEKIGDSFPLLKWDHLKGKRGWGTLKSPFKTSYVSNCATIANWCIKTINVYDADAQGMSMRDGNDDDDDTRPQKLCQRRTHMNVDRSDDDTRCKSCL